MQVKKFAKMLLIALPILLIVIQILWSPFEKPEKLQQALRRWAGSMETVFRHFDFNQKNALKQWEEKIFSGKVAYWVDFGGGGGFVHSKSENTSSAIFRRLKFDPKNYPILSWKWHAVRFPQKEGAQDQIAGDDFAARMYVVFLSAFFTNIECVEYVWDETLQEGTILKSPYSDQIRQLVVQNGPVPEHEWVSENRNIAKDYELLFGKPPERKVAAIAIMTDSEGTASEAEALFDDIRIGKDGV